MLVFLTMKVWGKTGSKIYGPKAGEDYKDNQLRFMLLCQACHAFWLNFLISCNLKIKALNCFLLNYCGA